MMCGAIFYFYPLSFSIHFPYFSVARIVFEIEEILKLTCANFNGYFLWEALNISMAAIARNPVEQSIPVVMINPSVTSFSPLANNNR